MKKGISLIVLVITIIVIIILAGTVVLSLSQNNPIAQASDAKFKSNIDAIRSELNTYTLAQYAQNLGNFDLATISGTVSSVLTRLPNAATFDADYEIIGGQLVYKGTDAKVSSDLTGSGVVTELVTVNSLKFNKPQLSNLPIATTSAVVWSTNIGGTESTISLNTANTDTSWYDYSGTSKKWANIKTTNGGNDAYWVWIPRYAYKILYFDTAANRDTYLASATLTGLIGYSSSKGIVNSDGITVNNSLNRLYGAVDIKFLAGTTSYPADKTSLGDYIVHPAFNFGGSEQSGIWIAKYEASSTSGYGGNTTSLQVKVIPDAFSWKSIYIGNMQTVCMNMTGAAGSVNTPTITSINTHQMKNVEWGAVAYLCKSKYGSEPWNNPYGNTTDWNLSKTGYSGASKDSTSAATMISPVYAYNTATGVNASTTGNIYGIYDMAGGILEHPAAYVDNQNANLGTYFGIYFLNNQVRPEYSKYYDVYAKGSVDDSATNYTQLTNKKGDSMYETSTAASGSWSSDAYTMPFDIQPVFTRGGSFPGGSSAGIFAFSYHWYGQGCSDIGFRPVLLVSNTAL
jgi:hypothetical protein